MRGGKCVGKQKEDGKRKNGRELGSEKEERNGRRCEDRERTP